MTTTPHIPVLLEEILKSAEGLHRPPRWYFDATFGRGGHTHALLSRFLDMKAIAADRDPEAVEYARVHFPQVEIHHADFLGFEPLFASELQGRVGEGFDLMLIDLGVSSPQLDEGRRGFSFYHSGPLDMRMNPEDDVSAADIVNTWDPDDLFKLFFELGEVFRPGRVVNAIVDRRQQKPFEETGDLADVIARTEGWRKKGQHPATRFFLALRLEVNQELSQVERALPHFLEALAPGGRLMVITFHSLEDRIVKGIFKTSTLGSPVNKKVIRPTWNEQKQNSRARSAKLRVFERTLQP